MTGHTANIEEPAPLNERVAEFLTPVESGRHLARATSGRWGLSS